MEGSELPLFERALRNTERPAIIAAGRVYTYQELVDASRAVARRLLDGASDLE